MPRKPLNAHQREAKRKANREYAARHAHERDHAAEWKQRKTRRNESRRAKYDRDWERQRLDWENAMLHVFGDLLDCGSLIAENALKDDLTRWKGPGAKRERRLEAQADKILAAGRRKPCPPNRISPTSRKPCPLPPESLTS
jgi:hypothetical protein